MFPVFVRWTEAIPLFGPLKEQTVFLVQTGNRKRKLPPRDSGSSAPLAPGPTWPRRRVLRQIRPSLTSEEPSDEF